MESRFSLFGSLFIMWFFIPYGSPVRANDTIASVKAGGIVLEKSDSIRLLEEKLTISPKKIHVQYIFKSESPKPIKTLVAFPIPPISEGLWGNRKRFDDFKVTVEGKNVPFRIQSKAILGKMDITAELKKQGYPVQGFPKFKELPETLKKWLKEKKYYEYRELDMQFIAVFELHLMYLWDQTFPSGQTLRIEHEYKPAIGSNSMGLINFSEKWIDFFDLEKASTMKCKTDLVSRRYPTDANELIYCKQKVSGENLKRASSFAEYAQYILSTGSNWKNGIEKFQLKVEGAPVIFIEIDGQRDFDLNTFELERRSFKPEGEILVEFLRGSSLFTENEMVDLDISVIRLKKKIDGPANCHVSPKSDGKLVKKISNGKKAILLNRKDDWYQVESDGSRCWIHKQYLK